MKKFSALVTVTHDPDANAATISFASKLEGRRVATVPLLNRENSLIGLLDFDEEGRLCQVELLDAKVQLPRFLDGD